MPYGQSALRGSMQAGDPFLGSIVKGIGGFIGKAAGVVGGILPGPLGGAARIAGRLLGGGPKPVAPSMPGVGAFGAIRQRMMPGQPSMPLGTPYGARRRRRMNPLNVKALRRSTRRLASFQREAKKVEKELRKLAPPRRGGARRDLGRGHVHVR